MIALFDLTRVATEACLGATIKLSCFLNQQGNRRERMVVAGLVIHCGTHKTATSAFQDICYRNHSALLRSGILYPKIKANKNTVVEVEGRMLGGHRVWRQHSVIARSLSANDSSYAEKFFVQLRSAVQQSNCHTVFLSGEDFENILVDTLLLEKLIKLSVKADLGLPKLVFTCREPMEYFCSIYGELSKKQVLIDFKSAAIASANTGYFACPVPDSFGEGFEFNSFFAIDAKGLVNRLSSRFGDLSVVSTSFDSFVDPSPGYALLSRLIKQSAQNSIDFNSMKEKRNIGFSKLQVEVNYVQNFLGVGRNILDPHIESMARKRLDTRKKVEPFVKNLFDKKFSEF